MSILKKCGFSQKEKIIHPLTKLTDMRCIEVKSAAKAGPRTNQIFIIPVFNYESQQVEIVTSTEFFKVMRDAGEFHIDLYDYKISIQMKQLPSGFLVGGKLFPQLIITKVGETKDATVHTIPSQDELKAFAQDEENRREEWRNR